MTEHGMDMVFYLPDKNRKVRFLVRDYALFDVEDVVAGVTILREVNGDEYDRQNLRWSAKAILRSIGMTLASSLEKYVTPTVTGPEIFFHIMTTLESSTTSAL